MNNSKIALFNFSSYSFLFASVFLPLSTLLLDFIIKDGVGVDNIPTIQARKESRTPYYHGQHGSGQLCTYASIDPASTCIRAVYVVSLKTS